MRYTLVLLIVCLSALAIGTAMSAPPAEDPALSIPQELQAAVNAAENTGRRIQRLDRAAWIATDAVQGDRDARKVRKAVRGWITEPIDTGTRVTFFDDADPARKLYRIDVESTGRESNAVISPEDPFTDTQHAEVRARRLAFEQSFLACSRTYNSALFREGDAIHVYLMPGTTKSHVHPAGGHHLFVFDGDGTILRSQRGFTRGCIDLEGSPAQQKDGFTPASMMITHMLDPQPTEIHVFISLNAEMPLMVATTANGLLWEVDQGRISLLDRLDETQ